jgi:hypothetical protein
MHEYPKHIVGHLYFAHNEPRFRFCIGQKILAHEFVVYQYFCISTFNERVVLLEYVCDELSGRWRYMF